MRWVGIDEAGYGPNLGPLVMTAVVAEGPEPNVWADLEATVCRAGGATGRLWIDDSKAILKARRGRDRLEAACLAAIAASGRGSPGSLLELFDALGAGTPAEVEIDPWLDGEPTPWPLPQTHDLVDQIQALRAFDGAPWRIAEVRTVVVGPSAFNARLAGSGSKATVHFDAFSRLLRPLWEGAPDGVTTHVRGDKHGGRHFYLDLLLGLFPDAWIDRGPEGPELSRYTVRGGSRRLELSLVPRADAEDGLVALASIVSKAVRESWMDVFNAYWTAKVPGLRPTAGYPVDATRFRKAIEPECLARGFDPVHWWRNK